MNPFDLPDADELFEVRAFGPRHAGAARRAFAEFHALLAAAERVEDVRPADLVRIGHRHGVDLAEHFEAERASLYERYAEALLARVPPVSADVLPPEDRARLEAFAATLHLSAKAVRDAHGRLFGRIALRAVADLRLTEAERGRLYRLKHALGLDVGVARAAYEALAREQLVLRLARHAAAGALSDAAREDLARAQEALGVALPDELVHLATPITGEEPLPHSWAEGVRLHRDEVLYAVAFGQWWPAREDVLPCAVPAESLVSLRAGHTGSLRFPEAALGRPLDVGRLLVTSERILLVPATRRRRAHALTDLQSALAFTNGVLLRFRSARAVFAECDAADLRAVFGALRLLTRRQRLQVRLESPA